MDPIAWLEAIVLYILGEGFVKVYAYGVLLVALDVLFGPRVHTLAHNWTSAPRRNVQLMPDGLVYHTTWFWKFQVAACIAAGVAAIQFITHTTGYYAGVSGEFTGWYEAVQLPITVLGLWLAFVTYSVWGGLLWVVFTVGGKFSLRDYPKLAFPAHWLQRLYDWGHAGVMEIDGEDLERRLGITRQHSRLWWFQFYVRTIIWEHVKAHRVKYILGGLAALLLLIQLRAVWQPLVLAVRTNIGSMLILAAFVAALYGLWWLWSKVSGERWYLRVPGFLVIMLLGLGGLSVSSVVSQHVSLMIRHVTLEKQQLTQLPLETATRIYPLAAVGDLGNERLEGPLQVRMPDYVRIGSDYRWTMPIEPASDKYVVRAAKPVEEVFSVDATSPTVTLDRATGTRQDAVFQVGEGLLFGRNVYTAVTKVLSPWKYLNYEADTARYLKNDDGKWVLVVSLVYYDGFFFPQPEFGGVLVIEQNEDESVLEMLGRMVFGVGTYVSPEEITAGEYSYLKGNNLVPSRVTRWMAESFRYQNGLAPVWFGTEAGDVEIPVRETDRNAMPYNTAWLELPAPYTAGITQYFATEPRQAGKSGLVNQLWFPADGTLGESGYPIVFEWDHSERDESLAGVSTVAAKVRSEFKQFDWSRAEVVEARPWIRDIAGERRTLYLAVIASVRADGTIIAEATSTLVMVDLRFNQAVQVDASRPDTWEKTVEDAFLRVWQSAAR